ncbi:carbohydrate sulfotransferase 11 [Lucilia sericata]|uniref:carbohydrate sulfotransferase 11 n=1 Tax=Lucilia sericata TaxID=13632 RepID=UPI0018A87C76|nr:carbohydrate sulfotransferase 11 [Lucilia sericata]XP_037811562.1 carbohydrate sulfotransferase 11 [Lucilia sericata]
MIIRLCYGRRVQASLKLIACILIAVFYFGFLFRESLNAFEQNKDKAEAAAAAIGLIQTNKAEPKLSFSSIKHYQKDLFSKADDYSAVKTTLPPIVTSTLNPVYEYSEEIHSATEKDLRKRRKHAQQVCKKYNLQTLYPPNPREFFISPGHNLVWCNVFKAASSTWMYYFNILGGYDIKYLQRTEFQPLELARKRFPRPYMQDLADALSSSLSFLFVRDPFERIVSGYRNKLEGGKNTYYKTLARRIISKFRKHPIAGGGRSKSGPTFNEFVQYLIDQHEQGKQFDEHWSPIYSFCTPCSINFTIIGKVETFNRDSEFIIRQAGLESLLLGTLPKTLSRKIGNLSKGARTNISLEKYFAEINRSTLDQLLKIYKLDFELFDYDYTKYYNYVNMDTDTLYPTTLKTQESSTKTET